MQKKHEDRLLFLKQFAKELIIQSKPFGYIPPKPVKQSNGEFIPLVQITKQTKPKFLKQIKQKIIPIRQSRHRVRIIKPQLQLAQRQRAFPMQKPAEQPVKQQIPQPEPTGEKIDLIKLNTLLQDRRVTVIECPGPGKFIIAKTAGIPSRTKISLSQQEIQEIIQKFSEKSKVPVISGLFKAAAGDMIITAVISELVGSRFIITKITPRARLEST